MLALNGMKIEVLATGCGSACVSASTCITIDGGRTNHPDQLELHSFVGGSEATGFIINSNRSISLTNPCGGPCQGTITFTVRRPAPYNTDIPIVSGATIGINIPAGTTASTAYSITLQGNTVLSGFGVIVTATFKCDGDTGSGVSVSSEEKQMP